MHQGILEVVQAHGGIRPAAARHASSATLVAPGLDVELHLRPCGGDTPSTVEPPSRPRNRGQERISGNQNPRLLLLPGAIGEDEHNAIDDPLDIQDSLGPR